jgi:hypothetical protein
MEEIQRYADLLALLDAPLGSDGIGRVETGLPHSAENDAEVEEWASLLVKARPALMSKTRLRICTAGLNAVHRHITTHPYID